MTYTRHSVRILLVLAVSVLVFSSCKKFQGDVVTPSFIHIDRIDVSAQNANAPSVETGFYTSLVDAVQLVYYVAGDTAETVLGTYQLPCTVPVLRQGALKYLHVIPVVKQNGVSGSRIQYPFYQVISLDNVVLAAEDTAFLGTLGADGEYHLGTHYYDKGRFDILMEDYFEPTSFSLNFDTTVTWVKDDPGQACTGQGYGKVHVPADKQYVAFAIPQEFKPRSSQSLYLEMDYWTDVELDLFMTGFEVSGSASSTKSIMALYPNKKWQKIYINMGRVWSQFNYNTPIAIFFQAMNTEGTGGDVRLDNVKLVAI